LREVSTEFSNSCAFLNLGFRKCSDRISIRQSVSGSDMHANARPTSKTKVQRGRLIGTGDDAASPIAKYRRQVGKEVWLIGKLPCVWRRMDLGASSPQLREELGPDQFEKGQSWQGLHRHALMKMIAYASSSIARAKSHVGSDVTTIVVMIRPSLN